MIKNILILLLVLNSCVISTAQMQQASGLQHLIDEFGTPECWKKSCTNKIEKETKWEYSHSKQDKDTLILYYQLKTGNCLCDAVDPKIHFISGMPIGVGFVNDSIRYIYSSTYRYEVEK